MEVCWWRKRQTADVRRDRKQNYCNQGLPERDHHTHTNYRVITTPASEANRRTDKRKSNFRHIRVLCLRGCTLRFTVIART